VGLTSGASGPGVLVKDMLDHLAACGFDRVEQVEEHMVFALPSELRAARGV